MPYARAKLTGAGVAGREVTETPQVSQDQHVTRSKTLADPRQTARADPGSRKAGPGPQARRVSAGTRPAHPDAG